MNIFINFATEEADRASEVVELLRSRMVDFSMNLEVNVPNKSGNGVHHYYRIHDFHHREIMDRSVNRNED